MPKYFKSFTQNEEVPIYNIIYRLERFSDGKHNLHFKYKDEFNKLVEDFLLEEDK